jgi:hypothetical protein
MHIWKGRHGREHLRSIVATLQQSERDTCVETEEEGEEGRPAAQTAADTSELSETVGEQLSLYKSRLYKTNARRPSRRYNSTPDISWCAWESKHCASEGVEGKGGRLPPLCRYGSRGLGNVRGPTLRTCNSVGLHPQCKLAAPTEQLLEAGEMCEQTGGSADRRCARSAA